MYKWSYDICLQLYIFIKVMQMEFWDPFILFFQKKKEVYIITYWSDIIYPGV